MFTAFYAACAAIILAVAWGCKDNPRRQDTRLINSAYLPNRC
jgi:hypothetical protein